MSLVVDPMRLGVAAECATPEVLREALAVLRRARVERLDAYTPYPVPGVEELLPARRTRLPWLAFAFGLAGAAFAYLVQWYTNAVDYPLDVGGRPLHSAPAFVPITFETMVLFAALALFFGLWIGGRLPELWNPLFDVEGFERASVDRFWIGVDARDPFFAERPEEVEALLARTGALRVVHPERVEPSVELPEAGA